MARKGGMATGVEVARISVKVSPDTKDFRRELKSELEEIERTLKGQVQIDADLNSAQAKADFQRMMAQMKAEGAKGVKVNVDVDKKTGVDDALKGLGKKAVGGLGGGGKGDGLDFPFPSFGSGINPAGWAVILAGITAAAAPVVGLISTSLAAIPGLLTSILAPIGAVTLGMKGIADAAAEAGLTDRVTGKKGKVKTTVGEALKSLQADVSNAFKGDLIPVFTKVIGLIQDGGLHKGFETIAHGMSAMADGFVDAVSQGPGLIRLNNSLTNIGTGLGNMRPGIQSFTNGLLGMVEQFTAKFPGISQWINEAAAGFEQWVAKVSADGSLQSAFSSLGSVIKEISSTVTNLAKQGIEFLSDPEKIQMTLDLLHGVESTLNAIMKVSSAIADAWNDMFHRGMDPEAQTAGKGRGRVLPSGKDFDKDGTSARVDHVTNRLQAAGEAADKANGKVLTFLGSDQFGGAGASAQRRGVGTDKIGGGGSFDGPDNKITPPDDTAAKAKLQEYNDFVAKVSGDVQTAMKNAAGTEGGTVPPPNFDQFKAAWNELPNVVNQSVQATSQAAGNLVNGVVDAIRVGGNLVVAAVQQWQNGIISALAGMTAIGMNAGSQLAAGMANGISAGTPWIMAAARNAALQAKVAAESALGIKSPSRVFMKIGDYTMQGMGKGMEDGIAPVLQQAKEMAQKVTDAFASGADPTTSLEGFTAKEESRMEKVLAWQSKTLNAQAKALDRKYKVTKDENLKAQADSIRAQKEEIDSQKEMLDLAAEFADLQGGSKTDFAGSPTGKLVEDMFGMPQDFLKSISGQAMSDLGIGGNGALEAIGQYAQGFANKYVFNVSNIDEALTAQANATQKQSLGMIGR